jgi:hypothetical protein
MVFDCGFRKSILSFDVSPVLGDTGSVEMPTLSVPASVEITCWYVCALANNGEAKIPMARTIAPKIPRCIFMILVWSGK